MTDPSGGSSRSVQTPWWPRFGPLATGGLVIALGLLCTVLAWLPGRMVLHRFLDLERVSLERDVRRVQMGMEHDLGNLEDLARDWSSWDDAYRFMQDQNAEFKKVNLVWRSVSEVSHLQLLAFMDLQGRLIWKGYRIDDPERDLPFPSFLASPERIQRDGKGFRGILLTPQGPLQIIARPILPSTGMEQSRGLIIMGRHLGPGRIEALRQRTAMDVAVRDTWTTPLLPDELLQLEELKHAGIRKLVQADRILASVYQPDLAGRGSLVVTLRWPREVYLQGLRAARTLSLSIFTALALIATLLHLGLRRYMEVMERARRDLNALVEVRTAELNAANRALEDASMRDPLTGLQNRRFVAATLPAIASQAMRSYRARETSPTAAEDMVFMIMDLDHFKAVNDLHGHAAGDAVLAQVAELLRTTRRDTDTVARWGGEEFLIVANRTHRSVAPRMARLLLEAIQSHPFRLPDGTILHRTCSIGWCAYPFPTSHPDILSWEQVLEMADLCLYAAKRSGRNGWVGVECPQEADGEIIARQLPGGFFQLVAHGGLLVRCSWDDPTILSWR